ncbi:MAG: hypothetical protein ACO1OG_03080 [Devosia sp.]
MMRMFAAVLLAGLSTGPGLALECQQAHAVYEQPGRQVMLHFSPVPRDGAANQIANFSIRIEGVDSTFEGGVYIPNGFGQPLGDIGQDCGEEWTEECRFWEGKVYALADGGIVDFPHDAELTPEEWMAPQQVLLPGFASNVWYSMERGAAFEGDRDVLDVFTLAACAK